MSIQRRGHVRANPRSPGRCDHRPVETRKRRSRLGNYAEEARTYDLTRGASPTVIRLVAKFLGPGAGRSVLDVAGGTGNYAQVFQARGFDVVVVDAEPAMARRSVGKIGPGRQVVADASALPFAEGAFDAAIMIHAIHLMADPGPALVEARRVVRGGSFMNFGERLRSAERIGVTQEIRTNPIGIRLGRRLTP